MVTKGYLYIAIGDAYLAEAQISAKSLRSKDKNAHITLITNKSIKLDQFDTIKIISENPTEPVNYKSGILYKVNGILNSPYKNTFFVDTDTFFFDKCDELFDLLEFYDLLIAPDASDRSRVVIADKVMEGYIPYNTGIIVFKESDKVKKLLTNWFDIYKEKIDIYQQDQPAFIEALLLNPINLYALHSNYNFRLPCYTAVPNGFVKIVHGRSIDFNQLESEINRSEVNRGWSPKSQRILMIKNKQEKLRDLIPKKVQLLIKSILLKKK